MSILSLHHGLLSAIKKGGPTPIVLPPYTIRFKTNQTVTQSDFSMGTLAVVDADNNIYDLTYENSSWYSLFNGKTFLTEVIDANTTGVTNMRNMFYQCSSLTSVPLFDTSSVTDMQTMFGQCSTLTAIPLFDTSSCTNMYATFGGCYNVESGALALYQRASSLGNVRDHAYTFQNCGRDTETGAAELEQIPRTWK